MFNSTIITFDGSNGICLFVPSFFVDSIPPTKTLVFFRSIIVILPSCFLNFPVVIFTLSPFLRLMFLLLCFFLKSFERWECTNFFFTCNGAFDPYFLCFPGFLLDFHSAENSFILHHYARYFCNSRPSFACLFCYCTLEYRAFWIALVIFQHNCCIVLKLYSCSVRPSVLFLLPYYDCENNLLSHVRPASLHRCDY